MANEIKPKSFRVTEEAKARFNELAKSENWTQDEALNQLIGIYEIEQAKITISDRKTEIEDMEMHLHSISEIYRMSLQLNQDAEERIKSAYASTLESNQKTIQDLQSKIADLETDLEVAAGIQLKNDDLEKENTRIYIEMQKTNDLCMEYKDKNDTLNGLLTTYKSEHEENIELQKKLQEMDKLQADMTNLRLRHESDLKICQLELREKHQTKLEELKNEHHKELEQATSDYKTVLQELDALRRENYSLKEQLLKKPATNRKKTTAKATTAEKPKE